MAVESTLTIQDLLAIYKAKLVCRHVSGAEAAAQHKTEHVNGDAYAIGAVHALTYPSEVLTHDEDFRRARTNRAIEFMTSKGQGLTDESAIESGGEALVRAYTAKLRSMVSHAVTYDDTRGNAAECHLILYRNNMGAQTPYDITRYPFGKVGKGLLQQDFCSIIALSNAEKAAVAGNKEAVTELLMQKIITQLKMVRTLESPDKKISGDGKQRTDLFSDANEREYP